LSGAAGTAGAAGSAGAAGATGAGGSTGPSGATGTAGAMGATGPENPAGLSEYAEFFALMPSDNSATVAVGTPVRFPQDGPANGVIARTSAGIFVLPDIGTYRVTFSVSVTEAGQLVLALDSGGVMIEQPDTLYGRATGMSEISGEALITTTVVGSTIELRNPAANPLALTITPLAGGTQPVVASVVIQRLS
jgi:BclA C-terminal domain